MARKVVKKQLIVKYQDGGTDIYTLGNGKRGKKKAAPKRKKRKTTKRKTAKRKTYKQGVFNF